MPILKPDAGAWVVKGHRVSVDQRPYWSTTLHRLVDVEAISEERFSQSLRTIVDKAEVAAWVAEGAVSDAQIDALDARTVMRVIRQVSVRPIDGGRPRA